MSDVIWTGEFRLAQALEQFGAFATAIETRLGKINTMMKGGGFGAYAKADTAIIDAETKRQQKITDQHLAHNISQAKKDTKAKEVEQKQQTRDEETEKRRQQRITDQHLAYKIRAAKEATKAEEVQLREQGKQLQQFFVAFTVGGFALQRFGRFLEQHLSQPLIAAAKEIFNTTTAVNDFEETLRVRGGKSAEQIEEIYKVVKKVSDLPNLDRSDILTIFSRIVEVTKGGITANELEKIGGGLSKITTSLEAGEKRAFYGQLQDILGGGNVANLEKTLSLVPLLKQKYDELKKAATVDTDDKTLVLNALTQLSELPNVDTITASIKRINNEVFEFKRRLGNLFKEDIRIVVDFIVRRVIPMLDELFTRFEKSSKATHYFALAIGALGVIIPPLISTLGAFALAIGGVGFAYETLGLSSLSLAGFGSSITGFLAKIPALLNPISLAIAAIIALLTYLVVYNIGGAGTAVKSLANTIKDSLGTQLTSIANILTQIWNLFGLIGGFQPQFQALGVVFSAILAVIELIVMAMTAAIQAVSTLASFIHDIGVEGLTIAWEKLHLAQLRAIKTFMDAFPGIAKLVKWITGVFVSEQVDINKAIADQEAKVKSLGGQIDDTKVKVTGVAVAHRQWTTNITDTTEAIKKLNTVLAEQSKAILDAQIASDRSVRDYQAKNKATGLTDEVKKMRSDAFEADISDPSKAAAAYQKLLDANALNLKAAQTLQQNQNNNAIRDAFKQNRDDIIKIAKDETNETLLDFYTTVQMLYLEAQNNPSKNVYTKIDQLLLGITGVDDVKLGQIKRGVELQKRNIEIARRTAGSINEQIDAATRDNQEQLDKWNKAADEIQKKKQELERKEPLFAALTTANINFDNAENTRKALSSQIDDIQSITKLKNDLAVAIEASVQAENARRQAELDLINASDDKEVDKIGQRMEAQRKSQENIAEIRRSGDKQLTDTIRSILGDSSNNSKRLRDLLTTFGDELKSQLDFAVEMASLGIKPNQDKIDSAIAAYNKLIKDTANVIEKGAIKSITDNLDNMFKVGQRLQGSNAKQGVETLFDFLHKFEDLSKNPLSQGDIDKMLTESEGLLTFLKQAMLIADFADDAEKADLQLTVKRVVSFIEQLKAARKTLADLKDDRIQNAEIKLGELENNKRIADQLREQLEIEERILEIRKQRSEIPNAPILSKVIGVLSGNQAAIDAAHQKILDNREKVAKLELDIDLQRLKIAQFELEMKIRGMDISKEEQDRLINESRELYNREVEQIKEKGRLTKELLDEQRKSESDFGGGILGSILNVFKSVFGKKKEKEEEKEGTTGWYDEKGTLIDGETGLPAIISDEATDKAGANAKKNMDWLDKLSGKMGKARDLIFGLGEALMSMDDFSVKGLLKVLADELKALSKYAAIKALQYAAIAVSALVFGDVATAKKAGKAAALWGALAIASGVAGHFLGNLVAENTDNAQASSSGSAGVNKGDEYDPDKDKQILKQKAYSIWFQMDIRTDEGIVIKKTVKGINSNTELTTLTSNAQEGWRFSPVP